MLAASWKSPDLSDSIFGSRADAVSGQEGQRKVQLLTLWFLPPILIPYIVLKQSEKKKNLKTLIKSNCCDENYTVKQTAYFKDIIHNI